MLVDKPAQLEKMITVGILCKFWVEDGVWNGTAEHLPVAVFGESFESAQKHLEDAIISHLEAVARAGKAEQLIEELRACMRGYLPIDEISPDSPLVKFLVAVKDSEFVSLMA